MITLRSFTLVLNENERATKYVLVLGYWLFRAYHHNFKFIRVETLEIISHLDLNVWQAC